MKKTIQLLISLTISFVIFFMLFMPVVSLAAWKLGDSLVPCGTETKTYKAGEIITPAVTRDVGVTGSGGNTNPTQTIAPAVIATSDVTLITNPCKFKDLMHLVNNVINFILFYMVIPIAAIMFAYAGFLLVTAGGDNAGARTKAKDIFLNALIGLIIAFAAYLIIKTIFSILGYDGALIGF